MSDKIQIMLFPRRFNRSGFRVFFSNEAYEAYKNRKRMVAVANNDNTLIAIECSSSELEYINSMIDSPNRLKKDPKVIEILNDAIDRVRDYDKEAYDALIKFKEENNLL